MSAIERAGTAGPIGPVAPPEELDGGAREAAAVRAATSTSTSARPMNVRALSGGVGDPAARGPSFVGRAWAECRQRPGAEENRALNEADFADALEKALPGLDYARSVAEFARWRWYCGENADGRHDPDAAKLPAPRAQAARLSAAAETRVKLAPAPAMLGTSYLEIERGPGGPDAVRVAIAAPRREGVRHVVQAVPPIDPGEGDGETLDIDAAGGALLRFPPGATKRTLIVTALPADGVEYDPDTAPAETFPATVVLSRVTR